MTLGSHQQTVGKSQNHITPLWLIDAVGGAQSFDLDPAGADPRPWDCAKVTWTADGLERDWPRQLSVYLNPPFNQYEVGDWIAKAAAHGNAMVLLHARTEAAWFNPIWEGASGILFLSNRIKFCKPDGSEQPFNSGAPAILVAFGAEAFDRLQHCGIAGTLVPRCWLIQAAGPPLYSPPRPPLTMVGSVP
jgi:hypothetical protein